MKKIKKLNSNKQFNLKQKNKITNKMQKAGNCDAATCQKHINEHCLRMTTAQKKLLEVTCPISKIFNIIMTFKLIKYFKNK